MKVEGRLRKYSDFIKSEATKLGFLSCGIAKAEYLEEESSNLEKWLSKGFQGEMKYLENHFDKRLDPRLLVDGAKSVISLVFNYYPKENQIDSTYKIAKYAYGKDYHFVLKEKLKILLQNIQNHIGEVSGRAFVDSAPVMERKWAEKAGNGWIGKNSLLLQKKTGSFFFLAELIIDLDLAYDNPITTDHCGTCTKCMDCCPTEAILPGKTVDGSKCISYLTIELKDQIPKAFEGKFDDWIFGCDICQDVCPWNKFSKPHDESFFKPHSDLLTLQKKDWEELTDEVFKDLFKKSAVKRTKFLGLKRNINFVKK